MTTFLFILFLLVCVLMTITILLQSSKGGGLAGTFGGSSMGTVFGGRGAATFLSKTTTILAILFLLMAFLLSKFEAGNTGGSDQGLVAKRVQQEAASEVNPASILRPGQVSEPAAGTQQQSPSSADTAR